MKYKDGLWRIRKDVEIDASVEVADFKVEKDRLLFQASPFHLATRGDTLKGPLFEVEISSPLRDVCLVQVDHFKGIQEQLPDYQLFPDGAPPEVQVTTSSTEDELSLQTGDLTAIVNLKPYSYNVDFTQNGKVLASTGFKSTGSLLLTHEHELSNLSETTFLSWNPRLPTQTERNKRYMLVEFDLHLGEQIYGLGERFGPMVKNGQAISMWNADGGTSSEQTYKNIPFFISSRGYGVFFDTPAEVNFEIGSEKMSRINCTIKGEQLKYFVIGGKDLKAVLNNYTIITGRPALPPASTFGLWLSTSFTTNYDQKTVEGFLEGMRDRNCPVRYFHFDCFWMKRFEWCNFTFDPDMFADPKKMLSDLKTKYNIKICVWINPYIGQASPLFAEGRKGGYFIHHTDGSLYQTDTWQPSMAIVDFTNPAACEWYASKLEALIDMGVDAFKTDFGERIPHVQVKFHNNEVPERVHNWFAFKYNEVVFNLLKRKLGEGEACVFARSATAGGQRFPVHWGGDCESTYEAMGESLRGGLSLMSSGFAFWSHDVGGFEGTPPAILMSRWIAFGLFSSHSRLHGSNSYRVPWFYEGATETLSKLVAVKLSLMPYIYQTGINATRTGTPVMRPMFLEFPNDPTSWNLDKQYMFGESLLVAPVFSDTEALFYLPEGKWTCFWTGELVSGPKWVRKEAAIDYIPVFARENSVIPVSSASPKVPDYDYSKDVELRVYALASDTSIKVELPSGKGTVIAAVLEVKCNESGANALVSSDGITVHISEGAASNITLKKY